MLGSYTFNLWVRKEEGSKFWRTFDVKGASDIPLLMCGNRRDCQPEPIDEPPPSKEWIRVKGWNPRRNGMRRVCHYRHGRFVNATMLDLSARAVGLKELWTIKWHREWPSGRDHLPVWPEWMADLPEP